MPVQKRFKDRVIFILYNLTIVFVFLAISEGLISYLLHHPSKIPSGMVKVFRSYYDEHLRSTIQMEPECAIYDNELFYTLKPGESTFENLEFKIDLDVNSKGVRDDEKSLGTPDVIFLGDSFTMGWGIPQDSTFASLCERDLNTSTLNSGISSYGTVRELKILKRFNKDSLKTIVFQYHYSDLVENREFADHHDSLVISSEEKYRKTSEMVRKRTNYYFGKHTSLIAKFLAKNLAGKLQDRPLTGPEDVKYFIHSLMASEVPLEKLNIVVFDIGSHGEKGNRFLEELKKEIAKPEYPGFIKRITIVDVQPLLNDDDYYILDDHINTSGHKKVSEALVKAIQNL
jgi:hypothetical protein